MVSRVIFGAVLVSSLQTNTASVSHCNNAVYVDKFNLFWSLLYMYLCTHECC